MDKQLLRFMNREINSVQTNVLLGREVANKGLEYITVTPYEQEKPLYSFWDKRKKPIKEKPKHTGGKHSYIKCYTEKLLSTDMDFDILVACFKLAPYLQWDSEYLENGKGNRRKYVEHKDIVKILKTSSSSATRLIRKMRTAGVLIHDGTGYKLTGGYFVKGVGKNEDKV